MRANLRFVLRQLRLAKERARVVIPQNGEWPGYQGSDFDTFEGFDSTC